MALSQNIQTLSVEDLLGRPLNDIERKFSPHKLYLAGREAPVPGPRTSIVGSRHPSSESLELARKIAWFLVCRHTTIVSGLANGIDTMAHETALENNGLTIAVLGTPLNKTYPAQNSKLQERIMETQWAVSQFAIGHPVLPKNFVIRNRTMALISDASVIVEAGETSGSLHQGWETLRLGRPLFICSSILENKSLRWPKKMMDYGAVELRDPEEIIEGLPSSEQILRLVA